ncbi:MAG TPA: SNF2 helicase-associated domain-containing protein, partial [Chthoniobacterales bacterium]|nr:SNF2 helicase-associated domain-containing protein [Chthoniobacterales bacterium]
MSLSLILTPHGHLRVQKGEQSSLSLPAITVQKLESAFAESSAAGLLTLATHCLTMALPIEMRWWRELACECLTAQCHTSSLEPVAPPSFSELGMKALTAPPMTGIEYLEASCLNQLWTDLAQRIVLEMTSTSGGPEVWLQQQNPSWRLLGRVTFHLAENKRDENRPFAFLATYTHQLSRDATPQYLPLGKALNEYAGAENRQVLLKLLSPVYAAAERSTFIRELLDSKKIFHPQAWTTTEAYSLLKDIPALEESGLVIRVPNWWKNRQGTRPKVNVVIGKNTPPGAGLASMLDFDLSMSLGGETLSEEEFKKLRESSSGLVFLKGQWIELDRERLETTLAQWKKMESTSRENGISFLEGMRLLSGMGPTASVKGTADDDLTSEWSHVEAGRALREHLEKLGNPASAATFNPGEFLQATLRPYQEEGIRWLWVLHSLGLGACLA